MPLADNDHHHHELVVEEANHNHSHNHNHNKHKWRRADDPVGEEVLRQLDVISGSIQSKEKEELIQEEWLVVATVMDRVAMWIFTVVLLGTIIGIFYQAPGYVS